jgi:hypothetical protein
MFEILVCLLLGGHDVLIVRRSHGIPGRWALKCLYCCSYCSRQLQRDVICKNHVGVIFAVVLKVEPVIEDVVYGHSQCQI